MLPLQDQSLDVVVSFQVIEHIPEVPRYLAELKRVLKADGTVLISTPNRNYRLLPFQKPWNPEHLREYSRKHLEKELMAIFPHVDLLGVYGTSEINVVEHNRVRQSPLKVYAYRPAMRLLKMVLPASIYSILKGLASHRARGSRQPSKASGGPDLIATYGLDDFSVGREYAKALDFLAICRKDP